MNEIWTTPAWPNFTYDPAQTEGLLSQFSESLGEVKGLHAGLTDAERDEIILRSFTNEAVSSFAIEGVDLDPSAVQQSLIRSMASRRLTDNDRRADDVVDMMQDARDASRPLDQDRLCHWHRLLFQKAEIEDLGKWRSFEMVIAKSNVAGQDDVLYTPVPAIEVPVEMADFLDWLNAPSGIPNPIRAAIAHIWFESIHPFSDGNGRIGRALIEYVFASGTALPFSLSQQINREKQAYYDALQAGRQAGRVVIDATPFVVWFLGALIRGLRNGQDEARFLVRRNQFFLRAAGKLSQRQENVLRKLFAQGPQRLSEGLSARSYAKMAGVASATATRDLSNLADKGVLSRSESGGRSARYLFAAKA